MACEWCNGEVFNSPLCEDCVEDGLCSCNCWFERANRIEAEYYGFYDE